MPTLRTLFHLTRADFLERARRYSFLVTLGLTTGDALALILLDRFITVLTFVVVGTVVYLYLVYVAGFGRVSETARAG